MQRGQESLDAVKVRTLPVQVAAHLTRRIVSGGIEDGRAPSELDIAREFGVSRVVARETLKILASLDIVDVAQGRRVVVRPPAEWDYLSPLLIEWLPTKIVGELLQELHQMRVLLEPELAAMAATGATADTLDRLKAGIDRMAALEADPNAYLEVDHEFHMEICRAADNRILDRIMYSARWLGTASRAAQGHPRPHRDLRGHPRARPGPCPRGDAHAPRQQLRSHRGEADQAGHQAPLGHHRTARPVDLVRTWGPPGSTSLRRSSPHERPGSAALASLYRRLQRRPVGTRPHARTREEWSWKRKRTYPGGLFSA
jgi:DNA-binding FadR family transcriptional regulator